ncbi:MAG: exodeoxyribonuclease V subunit beta [Syntrophales bacterium]|nr:exodeoxyribonuclease V subunit beta [Syntrophales bacterium]MDD4339303.1 exodeoxyribonuclease V subunit beta [Syntrophales bacterium]HOG08018.1 exodeoxyribonuclease V subunit beta [Syntrophales bacterium]HOS76927.1 exodeoxyribonuclease V subunit beta [Syntrophales bacterium]HQN26000.1 exodeoxyribonuclease V subunit beta [Syntrophales bacterium]
MDAPEIFNLLESPLTETNLIEASAGTGKTYAVEGIFLRLLLERGLSVKEILVVTYTVAATEELRDRIRGRVRAAVAAFTSGGHDDPFLDGLVRRTTAREEALRRLRAALRDFDEAPIHTIHGFCQRALREHAFETRGTFDAEMIPDDRALKEEIVRDFWRRHLYGGAPEVPGHALARKFGPEGFLELIEGRLFDPGMRILPEAPPVVLDALPPFREAVEAVRRAWPAARDAVAACLRDPGLKRNIYRNPDALLAEMDAYTAARRTWPPFDGFDRFTATAIEQGTRKGCTPPEHPFFAACETLRERAAAWTEQADRHLLFLKAELFRTVRAELRQRKRRRNIQCFDDLLLDLREALAGPGGSALAEKLRARYRAAVIDEFQDTDPIQYAIFETVFGHGDATLFLIGDPKQSIYSFRGADLFTYLRASHDVRRRHTLRHNWRSEPALIEAVNAVFRHPDGAPFLYDAIPFAEAIAGDVPERAVLTVDGRPSPPFRLWFLDGVRLEAAGAAKNQDRAADLIIRSVAAEISRLLDPRKGPRTTIGDAPLVAGDIAVLVRTNREARRVREALRTLGIPAVLHSTGNLFDTREAIEIERVLGALAAPRDEGRIRIALATDLMGLNGEALHALSGDETAWEDRLARFRAYHALWDERGFIPMFRRFLAAENVRERLLAFPDGERRLTNVLHLAEVLHAEAVSGRQGMAGLVQWLARQRDPVTPRLEEHELRLESDARAVNIVTIHKSKGLEYPVVFCPFHWRGTKLRQGEFLFHDPADDWRPTLVLTSDAGTGRDLALRETLAEDIRLLYVALTRARHRCYLVWGPFKDAGASALAYILHPTAGETGDGTAATEAGATGLDGNALRRELEALAASVPGAIALEEMPPPDAAPRAASPEAETALTCRTFTGLPDRDRPIASFSSLVADRALRPESPAEIGDPADLPDRDGEAGTTTPLPAEKPSGVFALPRGTKTGNLLHEILEEIDFTAASGPAAERLFADKLAAYGFDPACRETVARTIRLALDTPLDPDLDGLTLSTVGRTDRLSELGFYVPLNRLTPDRLERLLAETGIAPTSGFPEGIGRLRFQPVRGFMRGYMDLVFRRAGRVYLVDWKTNFLGDTVADYRPGALAQAMREAFYPLQYHLYVLALHRYLKRRLPGYDYDTHFGGVFYLFLRGLDSGNSGATGIYRDRPARETIAALERALLPAAAGSDGREEVP